MRRCHRFAPLFARAATGCSAVLLVAFFLPATTAAAPVISFRDAPYCRESGGDRFMASVWVDGGPDSISCFQVLLAFDRTRLDLVTVTEGDLFRNSGYSTFFTQDTQSDTTRFSDCLLGAGTFVQGPGELVRLEFELRPCGGPEQTPLDLTETRGLPLPPRVAYLTDVRRFVIPGVTFTDTSVRICQSCEVGIEESAVPPAAPRLDLSPNPVWHTLHIAWDLPLAREPAAAPILEIFAPGGRQVFARALDSLRGELAWTVAGPDDAPLASGTYFACVRTGRARLTKKFVYFE